MSSRPWRASPCASCDLTTLGCLCRSLCLPLQTVQFSLCFVSHPELDGREFTLGELLELHIPEAVRRKGDAFVCSSRVLIHGIEPALDTSLAWLMQNLSSADNFVYIVVLPK